MTSWSFVVTLRLKQPTNMKVVSIFSSNYCKEREYGCFPKCQIILLGVFKDEKTFHIKENVLQAVLGKEKLHVLNLYLARHIVKFEAHSN